MVEVERMLGAQRAGRMPSTSSQQTTIVTTLAIAILGLFFFTKKVC